ncbi:coiled-coil domain-containing protein 170 isoform X2 [Nelusetta ayraudi]|uniref:coiled-coil domain-containing protein 170 isoform X2 n=1 Tax=Nelusetta ayraudi TaxID=303726 RepID=UPI003F716D45
MEVKGNFVEGEPLKERERLQLRIGVLEESVKSCELESKAGRETVLRLVEELDQERRRANSSAAALDSVKVQLDGLVVGRKSIELEKKTLMEGLEASKRVTEAARRESSFLEKQLEELERRFQSSQRETRAAEEKLQMFLKRAAGLLQGTSDNVVQPTEQGVLQAADNICHKSLPEMDARLRRIAEQLTEQTELHNSSAQRAQLAGQQVQELREKVQALETELLSADVHREKLLHSRQHYEEFLDQLSETMKVDSIAVDLGSDMRMKVVLTRAEQMVQQETASLMESKCLSYSLQRKLRTQKDQLDSKGLHIQLLKKKVSELEEEKRSHSALATERDGVRTEARKLQKRLECLQGDLRASKQCNSELKAQLSHTDELKSKVLEQSRTVQEQKRRLERLAEGKAAAERKREEKSREEQQSVLTLRQSLHQLSEREREMLGLDVTAVAFPNYEIIKLLETRLLATHQHQHQHHMNTPWLCPTHRCLHGHHFPNNGSWVVDPPASNSPGPGDVASPHEA